MIPVLDATYSFALPLIKLSRSPSKPLNSFNNRLCKFSRDSSAFDFEILFARNQLSLTRKIEQNQISRLSADKFILFKVLRIVDNPGKYRGYVLLDRGSDN